MQREFEKKTRNSRKKVTLNDAFNEFLRYQSPKENYKLFRVIFFTLLEFPEGYEHIFDVDIRRFLSVLYDFFEDMNHIAEGNFDELNFTYIE